MDEKTLRALETFGLSDKESKVYAACVELGLSPAYQISLKADIPRTLTYDILKRLIELKLVTQIYKGKKQFFRSENPTKLLEILKDKEDAIKGVMKTLLTLQNSHKEKKQPHVHVFEGKEGIRTIYEDVLHSGIKEYICIGSSGLSPKILPYYMPGFYERKKKLKIKVKVIYRDKKISRERGEYIKKYGYVEVRYIPEKYATPVSIYCYANKTAFLIWSYSEPLAIRIDSKFITDGFRGYLNALWESAKK